MSIYYSKFSLNTYSGTPYFRAQVPKDYPVPLVLQKYRAFRRLPHRLRELSVLAKRWANRKSGPRDSIKEFYDDEGYELDPDTGKRLTDEEIDAQWNGQPPDVEVEDIPVPEGGFPNPDTWEEPLPEEEEEEYDGPSEDQILKDIRSHGMEYVARDYGIPPDVAKGAATDRLLARLIFNEIKNRKSPARSP